MKPGVSVPLGVSGRLLREFALLLAVLCHDLFRNHHLRLKLPAAREELDAGRCLPHLQYVADSDTQPSHERVRQCHAGRSAERCNFEFYHSHLPLFSRR